MDYSYIKQLLDRYWNGTTTLEEERILRAFFSQKDLPQEFAMYRDIFAYEAQKPTLGSDFDERMMAMIEEEKPVKARVISLRERMMPLLKAAAVVAVVVTLGNAMQVPFQQQATGYEQQGPSTGASVAYQDTMKVDSMPQSNLTPSATEQQMLIK